MRLLVFNMAMDLDTPSREFIVAWVRALATRVERLDVVTMRSGRADVPANVRVHSLGKERGYSEPRRAAELYRHLGRLVREGPIDACFTHMAPIFTVLAAPVLRPLGVPVVTWYAHPHANLMLRLAHRLSNRIVTSVATAYPYRHDKLVVIGQGIDTELFAPDGARPEQPPMVLCVGRLSPVKDHPTLLEAAARLRRRNGARFRIVIVGAPSGPTDAAYVRALHERVRSLGLADTVSFVGAVPMRDLPAWYRRGTVHVNLSRTGFGDKVVWEAMSCGQPCLVAGEGFRESLGPHAEDLLFRHGDADDLAARLAGLLARPPADLQRIGAALREGVVRNHGLERWADRMLEILRQLAATPGRQGGSGPGPQQGASGVGLRRGAP